MSIEDSAYDIFIDLNSESQRDLLCDSRATPFRITAFHLKDGSNEFFLRPPRSRSASSLWRKQQAIFSFDENTVQIENS